MKLQPNETEIVGAWVVKDGQMTADSNETRIAWLIENELEKVAAKDGGWSVLYRSKEDRRLWEVTYPQSQLHGGGPRRLRLITEAA